MAWLQIIIQTIIGWLLEIPPDLLGRRVERFLDRTADRGKAQRRKGKRVRKRKRKTMRAVLRERAYNRR